MNLAHLHLWKLQSHCRIQQSHIRTRVSHIETGSICRHDNSHQLSNAQHKNISNSQIFRFTVSVVGTSSSPPSPKSLELPILIVSGSFKLPPASVGCSSRILAQRHGIRILVKCHFYPIFGGLHYPVPAIGGVDSSKTSSNEGFDVVGQSALRACMKRLNPTRAQIRSNLWNTHHSECATTMSLSASSLGCMQRFLGGRRENVRRANWTGCRYEVKSDEKMCRVSGKRCVRKESGWPAEAARRAVNDAMLMCAVAQNLDERARNDFLLLSRQILRLDMRARADVALLGSGFLKLDARAREDVEKLDTRARMDMIRLRHIALGLSESASMELSSAAEEHWSDGALDADLRLADIRARRRAMEDLYAALQAVRNVHSALVSTLRIRSNKPLQQDARKDSLEGRDSEGFRSYLRNSDPALDRITAIQDAYWKMASALVEAEGMECTDPDELEFIVAALLDMEEVDGGGGALLVSESASSPDVATRLALADALADAPSLWTLGNVGMGALQRLSMDSNPAVAAAASKAINELKSQLRQQDHLIFPYGQKDEDEQPESE